MLHICIMLCWNFLDKVHFIFILFNYREACCGSKFWKSINFQLESHDLTGTATSSAEALQNGGPLITTTSSTKKRATKSVHSRTAPPTPQVNTLINNHSLSAVDGFIHPPLQTVSFQVISIVSHVFFHSWNKHLRIFLAKWMLTCLGIASFKKNAILIWLSSQILEWNI